ncbi:MAG: thioredoxin family protein [Muribaculaceae bacterium]|nr:thioredoxin family protein [Muribaculaceae bacterium]
MKLTKTLLISSALFVMATTSCSSGDKKNSQNDSTNVEQTSKQAQETKLDLANYPGDTNAPIGEYKNGVTHVNNQKALVALLNDKLETPVFIDFGATWCGPCQQFKPVFEEIANLYADRAQFFAVDVDQCPEISASFVTEGVPTLIVIYPDGSKATYIGTGDLLPAEKFEAIVQKAIKN